MGTLFNDIQIQRTDASNNVIQSLKVPLAFAPKDKILARVVADPTLQKPEDIVLPAMSFTYNNYVYDNKRKINTIGGIARKSPTDANKFLWQYNAVPIDINLTLWVYVKNIEDGYRILEQIIPFFRPDWSFSMELIPEMDISMTIPLILNSCSNEFSYEGPLKDPSVLTWTLEFTMKAYLFGPIKPTPIIKFANTNLRVGSPGDTDANPQSSIRVTPGMYANGEPTSNPSLSEDPRIIYVDDQWDFATETHSPIIGQ